MSYAGLEPATPGLKAFHMLLQAFLNYYYLPCIPLKGGIILLKALFMKSIFYDLIILPFTLVSIDFSLSVFIYYYSFYNT